MNDAEELASDHRVVLRLEERHLEAGFAAPQRRVTDELIFDNWRWFRRRIPFPNVGDQKGAPERVSEKWAYELAQRRLEPGEIPGELCFHATVGVPARVDSCDINKTCQFDPRRDGWRLIGHRPTNGFKKWDSEYLFESDGTYLLIFETGHIRDPKARILGPSEAAGWFVDANISVPEELQSYADGVILKPTLAVAKDDVDGRAQFSTPVAPPAKDPAGGKATRDTGNDIGRVIYELRSTTPQPSMKTVRKEIVQMGFTDQHESTLERKLTKWCTANKKTVPKPETNRGRRLRKGRPS